MANQFSGAIVSRAIVSSLVVTYYYLTLPTKCIAHVLSEAPLSSLTCATIRAVTRVRM